GLLAARGPGAAGGPPGKAPRAPPPAGAAAEPRARSAGPARLRAAQPAEQLRALPHPGEPAGVPHVPRQEAGVDGERAGVHVADRVDQAHDPPGAAPAETGQRAAVAAAVDIRIAGEHVAAV